MNSLLIRLDLTRKKWFDILGVSLEILNIASVIRLSWFEQVASVYESCKV